MGLARGASCPRWIRERIRSRAAPSALRPGTDNRVDHAGDSGKYQEPRESWMISPTPRPPLGPHSIHPLPDPEPSSPRRRAPRLRGFLEELRDFVGSVELRRSGWGATQIIPAFTLTRTRARLLAA